MWDLDLCMAAFLIIWKQFKTFASVMAFDSFFCHCDESLRKTTWRRKSVFQSTAGRLQDRRAQWRKATRLGWLVSKDREQRRVREKIDPARAHVSDLPPSGPDTSL